MPFKSQAQRRYMYAAAKRGTLPKSVLKDFASKTPAGARLPERVGAIDPGQQLGMVFLGVSALLLIAVRR